MGLARCATSDVRMQRMASAAHRALAAVIFVATIARLVTVPVAAQSPIDVYELADYRLTTEVFERFVQANGRIVDITLQDSSFTYAPLFTKDVALSGDAVAEAAGLMARLANHAGLAAALEAAKITPREYSKFAITLIAARLAHRFMTAGVLARVPSGAPTINVEFVKTHESDVTAALASLGIRD
jgi:hypothetical protein